VNIDQWLLLISQAYQSAGEQFSPDKRAFLLTELSENITKTQKEILAEVDDIMIRFFFSKASRGETFGSLKRIKEQFGSFLEENYGLSSGPFIDMAKTYWTYKLEAQDLFPEHHRCALSQILLKIETDIAGVFFPTPGPRTMPASLRRETQRQLLQEYAPSIDIERFLSESPILKVSEGQKRGGISGIFGKLFGKGMSKEDLIKNLVRKRIQNDPIAKMLGNVDDLPDSVLMGLPEATIVTIVETYCVMKQQANLPDEVILEAIEAHRSTFGDTGTIPSLPTLSSYIKYRLSLEHPHGASISNTFVDKAIDEAKKFFT
jgi:hypothetical protein